MGVIHRANPKNKRIKCVTRLVVHPDYQGIGIGTRFLNCIAEMYRKQGYDFEIITSAKNLIHSLKKTKNWKLVRWSTIKSRRNEVRGMSNAHRINCKTASFFHI